MCAMIIMCGQTKNWPWSFIVIILKITLNLVILFIILINRNKTITSHVEKYNIVISIYYKSNFSDFSNPVKEEKCPKNLDTRGPPLKCSVK